jgi:hypothetical protein
MSDAGAQLVDRDGGRAGWGYEIVHVILRDPGSKRLDH